MPTVLIVPGLYGSELQHWQSWMERKLPNTVRVEQADWDTPILSVWANNVVRYIDQSPGKLWIIAHSFGCLASVVAAHKRPDRIAGAMFVAPAEPAKFTANGLHYGTSINANPTVPIPKESLGFPSVVVASSNDPWMRLESAELWAERWDSHFINIGNAGHINVASGFGSWSFGLKVFEQLQQTQQYMPVGSIS